MVASTKLYDMSGNQQVVDGTTIAWDSMTNAVIPSATRPTVTAGTAPPTFIAPKGSLYTNLTGSSTVTRLYVNTDGAGTWTPLTAGA